MKQSIHYHLYIRKCIEYCVATLIVKTEENQLLSCDLQSISALRCLANLLALPEEIRVGALGLLPNCVQYELETRLSRTQKIRVLELELRPICAENVHETWLGTHDEIRILTLDVQPMFSEYCLKTCLAPSEKFFVLFQLHSLSAVKMCTKHYSRQTMKIVYWQSTCRQFLLNMVTKPYSCQLLISCTGPRNRAYLC